MSCCVGTIAALVNQLTTNRAWQDYSLSALFHPSALRRVGEAPFPL